jgi:hypothetical protein
MENLLIIGRIKAVWNKKRREKEIWKKKQQSRTILTNENRTEVGFPRFKHCVAIFKID